MRYLALTLALGVIGWSLAGCAQSPKVSSAATAAAAPTEFACPMCKEKVTWVYGGWPGSPKGIPTGRKVVTHTCPHCQKEWSSNLSVTTTCSMCGDAHEKCPMCQQH